VHRRAVLLRPLAEALRSVAPDHLLVTLVLSALGPDYALLDFVRVAFSRCFFYGFRDFDVDGGMKFCSLHRDT
jgi:hypothetical protein